MSGEYHVAAMVIENCVRMCGGVIEELFDFLHCFSVGFACCVVMDPSVVRMLVSTALTYYRKVSFTFCTKQFLP